MSYSFGRFCEVMAAVTIAACAALAQPTPSNRSDRIARDLEKILSPVGVRVLQTQQLSLAQPPAGSEEVHLTWTGIAAASAPLGPPASSSFSIRARRKRAEPVVRLRSLGLHPQRWLVVAVDDRAVMLSWQLIHDPRILRAEEPGPDGVLTGRQLVRTETDFLVSIPDAPAVREIRIYQPRWSGTAYVLVPLGTVALR